MGVPGACRLPGIYAKRKALLYESEQCACDDYYGCMPGE